MDSMKSTFFTRMHQQKDQICIHHSIRIDSILFEHRIRKHCKAKILVNEYMSAIYCFSFDWFSNGNILTCQQYFSLYVYVFFFFFYHFALLLLCLCFHGLRGMWYLSDFEYNEVCANIRSFSTNELMWAACECVRICMFPIEIVIYWKIFLEIFNIWIRSTENNCLILWLFWFGSCFPRGWTNQDGESVGTNKTMLLLLEIMAGKCLVFEVQPIYNSLHRQSISARVCVCISVLCTNCGNIWFSAIPKMSWKPKNTI